MIRDVTFEHTSYQQAPGRFEAGTGNIADAVGLGAAIDYVTAIGMHFISQYEHYLLQYATRLLTGVPGLHIIGTAADKAGVLSFILDGYKTEDVGQRSISGALPSDPGITVHSRSSAALARNPLCARRWLYTIPARMSTHWSACCIG